jgi:hypothetical protein
LKHLKNKEELRKVYVGAVSIVDIINIITGIMKRSLSTNTNVKVR